MKRYIYTLAIACFSVVAYAQDSYSNYTMTSNADVIGSARYVGMGGAMGALGADISAMSNNPASLGLFRKNDMSLTMGGVIQDAKPAGTDGRGHFSFDQVGFVASFPDANRENFFNFAVNFQKKADFGRSMFVQGQNLNGLSQAAQLKGLYDYGATFVGNKYFEYSLPFRSYDANLYDITETGKTGYHQIRSDSYDFNRYSSGNLYGLDFGFAASINNRAYLGIDFGVDFMNYESDQRYIEYRNGEEYGEVEDYDIVSNKRVTGSGFNIKFGGIVRPIEDNALKFGFAVETPTWYALTQKESYFSIASKFAYDDKTGTYDYLDNAGEYHIYDSRDDNFLEFKIHAPWKFRFSLASTVSNFLAWDVEYEYALFNHETMGYPRLDDYSGKGLSMNKDPGMSDLTRNSFNGVHNIRAGLEFKPLPEFAVRLGYNFWSKPMKTDARLDQTVDSKAVDFLTGTDYINLGATNMLTFGLGYRGKNFYADFAYKYRAQKGDFYAFDDYLQRTGSTADYGQFMAAAGQSLAPQSVDLSRHTITFTLGVKF